MIISYIKKDIFAHTLRLYLYQKVIFIRFTLDIPLCCIFSRVHFNIIAKLRLLSLFQRDWYRVEGLEYKKRHFRKTIPRFVASGKNDKPRETVRVKDRRSDYTRGLGFWLLGPKDHPLCTVLTLLSSFWADWWGCWYHESSASITKQSSLTEVSFDTIMIHLLIAITSLFIQIDCTKNQVCMPSERLHYRVLFLVETRRYSSYCIQFIPNYKVHNKFPLDF